MPRRRPSSARRPRTPWWLPAIALLALVLFGAGELVAYLASDTGRTLVFGWLGAGDRAAIERIVGRRVRAGLAAAHVPPAQVHEEVVAAEDGGRPRWQVALTRDGSPLQVNYEVTRALDPVGAQVISGHEQPGADGALTVTLVVGVRGRPLQEVIVARPPRPRDRARHLLPESQPVQVAVVLQGLAEAPQLARALLARREPFAVAAPAGGGPREPLRRAIHASGHELVLLVPMEPENYPHVNPGPGTLLVSMPAGRVRALVRADLHDAGAVAAVANGMGSFATQDEPFMTAVYAELKREGVPFLHLAPVPRAVCRPLAAQLGEPYDEPDAALDAEARAPTPAALARAWRDALAAAARRGRAIVLLRVTPVSARWLDAAFTPAGLDGATLVPLSALLPHP